MTPGILRRQYLWISASLYRKYVLTISLLVVGVLLLSGGLDIFFAYQDKMDSVSDLQRERAYFTASSIDRFIGDVQTQLEQAASVVYEDTESGSSARKKDYLALAGRVPSITGIGYWDSMGQQVFMTQEPFYTGSSTAVDRLINDARANGASSGPVYLDDNAVHRLPIGLLASGVQAGVLIAEVDLNFVRVIVSQFGRDESGWAYVVDSNGFIVAHPSEEYVTQRTNVFHLPQVQTAIKEGADLNASASGEKSVTVETSLDGQSVFATSFPIGNMGWSVLVERPRGLSLASLQVPVIRGVLLTAGVLVLAVLLSLIIGRRLASPIVKLRDDAGRLAPESADDAVDPKNSDELHFLGRALVRMSDQLKESRATLDARVEQRTRELARSNVNLEAEISARKEAKGTALLLERAMAHSPNAVLITDADGIIEYVNSKFSEVTGYAFEEVIGKRPSILKSGRTSQQKYDRMWSAIQSGEEWNGELYNKRSDGKFYWSSEKIVPIKDAAGVITHYLAVEQDVTEQRKAQEEVKLANQRLAEMNRTLEQRVTERTSELQQVNDRLVEAHDQLVRTEKLAAIGELSAGVAHDLRNPLGAIKNAIYYLNGKLLDAEPAKTNPRINEFLKIIDNEVGNANKIITDLMDFARVSTPTFATADLGTLVQDCLGSIELNDGVYINVQDGCHEDLMQVQADGRQLHRVFQNLIQNAQDAMPNGGVITVSTKEDSGFAEVTVMDTGEGIRPEHLDKIFDPLFTTKTKGTGLGLAVCHQIVSQHGGMIEVKSRLGVGALFKVRLPVTSHEDLSRKEKAKEALNASS